MKREEVFLHVENCVNGKPASCIAVCPFHLNIKSFLKKVSKGRLTAALQEIEKTLPFPIVINEMCPGYCEKNCQRKTVLGEETISIQLLEKTCIQQQKKKERKSYQLPMLPQRAAVVGAGPVGLACALYLSRKRYGVDVYEKTDGWGGSLKTHDRFGEFDEEFLKKFEASDVEFLFEKEITNLEQLQEYDVIFLATGENGCDFGLKKMCNPQLGTTEQKNVFLGGGLLGLSVVEGMAHAMMVAKAIESYIQTGDPKHALMQCELGECVERVPHKNETSTIHIVPAGEIYTAQEAQQEAERCTQCDCEECLRDCELLTKYKKKPPRIAIDVAQDAMTRNSVSSACITRQTWSCNLCGHCEDVCENHVNMGTLFEMSRKDRVESGNYPPAFHGYWMKEMEQAVSEAGICKPALGAQTCSYLFFPGCRLGAVNPEYVLRSYEFLLAVDGQTGIMLDCCGIPALWAGEQDKLKKHLEHIRSLWMEVGKPAVVYACSSCRKTFERFLPEIPLISLYEILAQNEKIWNGKAQPEKMFSVFDPCAAGPMQEVKTAVRHLAEECGCQVSEYTNDGKCCGYGGHIQLANPEFYDEITQKRAEESPWPYLVYCANCLEVFQAREKETVHILDLIFDLPKQDLTTLEEKRKHNIYTKQMILEKYWKEQYEAKKEPWEDMQIQIPKTVVTHMERMLIPESEIRQTIWVNEQAGEGFENSAGEVICRMVTEYMTCWVKYKKETDIYHVLEVYSHRMHIREE